MSGLEKALVELNRVEDSARDVTFLHDVDVRAKILVALFYIVAVLSLSLRSLTGILVFTVIPMILATMGGIDYGRVFMRSLIVLPFVVFIGIFNPIFNHTTAFMVGNVAVSQGWVEFVSIVLRGILAVQMVLLLIMSSGFYQVCRGLALMKVPGVFITQLILLYRYIFVLIGEAITMDRARKSRSYGRDKYPLRMWGAFVGQLLLRSIKRAERIHQAMLSRGFNGRIESLRRLHWRMRDTAFAVVGCGAVIVLRVVNFDQLFSKFFA